MPSAIVDAHGIQKRYGETPILTGLDLQVQEGTIGALLGPNGAGKTTLVRILSTLTRFDGGDVSICGHDVVREPTAVQRVISLTGQYAALDEMLTGEENLLLAARLRRLSRNDARRRSHDLLERFELTGAARKTAKTYSGGMKRKLDLAMSLIGEPRVLFLDEPTTGLDPRSRNVLWDLVRELKTSGVTVLLTTQYLEEADQLADRITMIHHGRVAVEGPAEELKRQVGNEVLRLHFLDHRTTMRASLALRDQQMTPTPDDNSIQIATDGTTLHIHTVLGQLMDASIATESIALHKPTLDDVFLSLTDTPTIADETDRKVPA
ncbi:MAG TPA: ATP-binding cassette domain-containing protein [Thermomicrobiales bacterium]|nr:ATP-binding cassette domain-containing protein [Thermomicrobiales bacterium]